MKVSGWKNTTVFGLQKRNWNVSVSIVPDCSRDSLMPILYKEKFWNDPRSTLMVGQVMMGLYSMDTNIIEYFIHTMHHTGIHFVKFARWKSHVNGIEAFWSFAKRRMIKLNGIRADKFHLHLKECEFRYNYRNKKEEALRLLLTKISETLNYSNVCLSRVKSFHEIHFLPILEFSILVENFF